MPFAQKVVLLFTAGLVGGVVNAIVGGGTLLTFPALLFAGMPAIPANATNTLGVLPGVISSQWAYRRELASQTRWLWRLLPPSVIGGLLGAFLLLHTEEARFREFVPYLILFATVLFTFSGPIARRLQIEPHTIEQSRHAVAAGITFQFCVGIYGGYFGAGIGILMLAALAMLGQKDIHQMNALRVSLGVATNAAAAVYFIVSGLISWTEAGFLAAGTIIGGYVGPVVARAIGQKAVRIAVSAVGFVVGIYFLLKQ
jgi:uncharacterized protein